MVDVNQEYVPLHLHTEYSLLDGAIRIGDLVKFCAENNMPGVAVTDHGVMYGAMDLYIDADKNNSKEKWQVWHWQQRKDKDCSKRAFFRKGQNNGRTSN